MKPFSISLIALMMLYVNCYGQNVGIGTASPIDKLTIQTATNAYGITHTDGTIRLSSYLGSGSSGAWLGTQTNHSLSFYTNNSSQRLTIATDGNIGIGTTTPAATLDVVRGAGVLGTAVFRGTNHTTHFNYSTSEDTYIRGGKPTSNVIINDFGNNVGIGVNDPSYKLDVGNRMRIRSQGTGGISAGIWFNNYDNSGYTGFIGDVGPGAPDHMGLYGYTSGWSLVMNSISGNVGINTFNTIAGNTNAKLNISGTNIGHAIKLYGNGQFISFYDAGNNYKGYMWNNGNNIEIGTDITNPTGELQLKVRGLSTKGLTVLNDGRVKIGELPCNIELAGGSGIPMLSVNGSLGIKKDYGDKTGEWAIRYGWPGIVNHDLRFFFNGGLKAWVENGDGSWTTASDIRLKENFEPYKSVLEGIKKLDVLTYHYKANVENKKNFGLIAQNVRRYFPEIVSSTGGKDNLLGIDYSKTGVLAIKAIQEQQKIIEELQRRIEELEKRLEKR